MYVDKTQPVSLEVVKLLGVPFSTEMERWAFRYKWVNDKLQLQTKYIGQPCLLTKREYYELGDNAKPVRTFQIPLTPRRGALRWYADVKAVWRRWREPKRRERA